eukprot:1694853-Karenia_brevis.AAC.1
MAGAIPLKIKNATRNPQTQKQTQQPAIPRYQLIPRSATTMRANTAVQGHTAVWVDTAVFARGGAEYR